jgi:hypothetical protein
MKKFVFALAGLCAVTAFAALPRLDDSIPELNNVIKDLLSPYQNATTSASLEFKTLTTDQNSVLTTNLLGEYKHTGRVQAIDVQLQSLSLDADSGRVRLTGTTDINFDFTKALRPDTINKIVENWEPSLEGTLKDNLQKFGPAFQVKAIVLNKTKDERGNYTSLRSLVNLKIDPTKLPPSINIEDVPFFRGVLMLNANATRGLTVGVSFDVNPAFKNYVSMKSKLEKFLARDPDMGKKFVNHFEMLNLFGTKLTDLSAQ